MEIPPIVTWVFEKVFPVMATLSTVMENLDEMETRVKYYTERIVTYRDLFVGMVNGMRRGGDEQPLDLSQCIRFYGLLNTKFFVVGDKMNAAGRGEPTAWDEKGKKPKTEPKKTIAYAASLLEAYGDDSLYREVAFSSGLVFDLLLILAEGTGERKAMLKKEIDVRAKRAKERADSAITKAKQRSQMPLAKHLVSGYFMTEAGRLAMAIHYPNYLDLLKSFEKGKVRVGLQHIVEEAKFKTSHNVVAALLCQVTPGLSPAARGTLLARYPFVLAKAGPKSADSLSLAELLNQPY